MQHTAWYRRSIPLWWRHFFLRFGLLATTLSALAFGLFILVDVLSHIKDIFDTQTEWKTWRAYYICMLSYRLDTFVPFSLAAATALFIPRIVRTNELIPLLNAGVSLRQISLPFLTVALAASCLLWINTQFFLPRAIKCHHRIVESDFGRKVLNSESTRLGVVLFPEGSRLFFYQHDPMRLRIDDAFWVRSADCILHIEKLFYFRDRPPEGHGVDVIEREPSGQMKLTASYPFCELSQLQFSRATIKMSTADPRELSITQLGTLVSRFGVSHSERAKETTIAFYTKILSPLLALLAVVIPAPLCFRFERRYPQALLVFGSLAFLLCFLLAVHASVVLARIPLVRPTPMLLVPWIAVLFVAVQGIRRIRT